MPILLVPCRHRLRGDLAINGILKLFPFGNKIIVVVVGVMLLQREALETKAVGGASTVKVERRNEQYLDGAQRAVQSEGDSRKVTTRILKLGRRGSVAEQPWVLAATLDHGRKTRATKPSIP